jgi:nucleoside-diphosphate-sugar epimerase
MAQKLSGIAAEQGLGLPGIVETGNSKNELLPELVLDNSRLRELTGWVPQIALEQGLRLALREFQIQSEDPDSRQ